MTFWIRYKTASVKTLVIVVLLFIAGCTTAEKPDIIWGFNETELNPVKAVYDPNDKVIYYEVTTKKDHTGWYISNRVMKQAFKIEIK